jgi:hypothetical protein
MSGNNGGSQPADDYSFFHGNVNVYRHSGLGFIPT